MKPTLLTIFVLVMLSVPTFAQKGNGHRGGRGQNQQKSNLNLTAEQTYQLDTLRARFRRDMHSEMTKSQELRKTFMAELKKEKPSQKELNRIAAEIGKQTEKRQLAVAVHLQQTRTILSEEQYQELLEIRSQHMQKMKGLPHNKGRNSIQ